MAVQAIRSGDPWTREDEERLLELDDQGRDAEQMAAELGRSVWAVRARLQDLQRRRKDKPVCRNCAHYVPTAGFCNEWNEQTVPDQTCRRFDSVHGAATDTSSIVWLDTPRRWGGGKTRGGAFLTIPKPGGSARITCSADLSDMFDKDGEPVQIGVAPTAKEVWIKRHREGRFRVSKCYPKKNTRSIGGSATAELLRQTGMPPGRYYLDEVRSGKVLMVFVWRGEEKRS